MARQDTRHPDGHAFSPVRENLLADSQVHNSLKFSTFNFETYEEYEPAFGQLAELLCNLGKGRVLRNNDIPEPLPTIHRHGCLGKIPSTHTDPVKTIQFYETLQLLHVVELLCATTRVADVFTYGPYACRAYGQPNEGGGSNQTAEQTDPGRKVTIVLFGNFFLEEIRMPRNIENTWVRPQPRQSEVRLVRRPIENQPGF